MRDPVWLEPPHHYSKTRKARFVFTWLLWDIIISKPPYVTFLKMVELCHFLSFSDLSERNYNSQSCWITLYHYECHCWLFSVHIFFGPNEPFRRFFTNGTYERKNILRYPSFKAIHIVLCQPISGSRKLWNLIFVQYNTINYLILIAQTSWRTSSYTTL